MSDIIDLNNLPIKVHASPKVISLEIDVVGVRGVIDLFKPQMGEWREVFGLARQLTETDPLPDNIDLTPDLGAMISGAGASSSEPAPAKRGRKAKAVEAVAPAPIPVGEPVAPAPVATVDLTTPPALVRAAAPPVVAAPPAPVAPPPAPMPPAPSIVPTPPVAGPLAQKCIRIIETVRAKVKERDDGDAAYGGWLHSYGLTAGETCDDRLVNWIASTEASIPGANPEEVIFMLQMTSDDKLAKIAPKANDLATALSIA